jgi:hypothetical protein
MDTKRITRTNTKIISDNVTGEILVAEQYSTSVVSREPDFVKLYVKDIGGMLDLTKSDNKVLFCLLKHMSYSNIVYLVLPVKNMIMKELDIPLNTVNDSIRNLSNSGILIRQAQGCYLVNPTLFARGKWEDIVKIRMEIEYSSEGKVIKQIDITNNKVTVAENSVQ